MLEYGPFTELQDQMIADIAELLENKYPHVWEEYTSSKKDNVITMKIIFYEEPIEVDDDEDDDTRVTVFDIDPELLEGRTDDLSEEEKQLLKEYLFIDAIPLDLAVHLLHCAASENKARNAEIEYSLYNGRSVSLMLCAMHELGMLVFQPRGDMLRLLTYIFGTRVEEDKHFLDYFYSRKDTKRVIQTIVNYKEAIRLWLNAIK